MPSVRHSAPARAFDAWISAINQTCGRFRADVQSGDFSGGLKAYESSAVRASMVEASDGTHLYRTPEEVQEDDSSKFFAVLQLRGRCGIAQSDTETVLSPGDITLVDAAHPFSVKYIAASRQVSLILPRLAIERNLRAIRVHCAQRVPASTSAAGLARHLILATLRQTSSGLSRTEGEAALDAVVHLLRPAIGNSENPHQGGNDRLQRALDFIDDHIDAEELTPESIAQCIGISVRGLYRLFATQGLVVAQYIRNRRLDLCAETLRSMNCPQKLAAVGYTWGFSDSSHFSTAFKARFGISPGEYRRQHTGNVLAD
ncbi:transcriptional regulator FeaR [Bordetella sp. J329]|jgi:AraC family transcriptional activator of tynA and feaB|uniref:transcriptional regulator FeaR n=1 Tax=Kerstersia gyiorum TaxID=206506 RepID=UPI000FDC8364|nr:transcriptional regulator FeaR [Kerstersia gyiorum]AZV92383.1 transcriptional regulator FeaR [Bordetella sp. J329]MCH4270266.1 transcriptional regulator FeaR [Kerstersia gyiorum]MCI1228232.1 transcriptional regulator FeaR [Kerstersia gyiorum]